MGNLKDLDAILGRITGKSLKTIAEDIADGKSEEAMIQEVSDFVRNEHQQGDLRTKAIDDLIRQQRGDSHGKAE